MNDQTYLIDVLAFASKGNNVVPVRNKRALVEWTKDATDDPGIIEAWWRQYGKPDYAWVMPSGVMVVDIDDPVAFKGTGLELVPTAMQETAKEGCQHHVYRIPEGQSVKQGTRVHPGVDFKVGGSGYVVLYDPRRLLARWAEMPSWVVGSQHTNGHAGGAARLSGDTLGTRSDILLALGTIAGGGKGMSAAIYRGMLTTWRAEGTLVALDPKRPWTDDDLSGLAEQAEEWDQKAIADRAWGRALIESLRQTRQEPPPPEWPEAPAEEAFLGLAGDIIASIAESTESDPVGLLVGLLVAYGAMVGGAGEMHAGRWQKGNLFAVQCGPTNDGRKGTTFDNVSEIMSVVEPRWQDGLMVFGLGSGEGLIRHLTQQQAETPKAFVYEPEFARLLNSMSWSGSTLSPILRAAWDGAGLGRAVSSSAIVVPRHHVSLLANITETELRSLLTSSDQANGFANRFLWIATRRQRLLPDTLPLAHLIEQHRPFLNAAFQFGREQRDYHWDEQARERWHEFYAQKIGFGLWQAMTSRRQPMVVRLALVQAMFNRSSRGSMGLVTLPIIEAAIALVEYSERTISYLFRNSTGNRNSDALLDMLRREGEIKWKDAKLDLGIHSAADIAEVIDVLVREGLATVHSVVRPGGGRPTRIIKLKKGLDA